MGIDRRIQKLEKLYEGNSAGHEDRAAELERRQEKMKANLERAEERAALEEAQGDSRRRRALEDLYKWMQHRN